MREALNKKIAKGVYSKAKSKEEEVRWRSRADIVLSVSSLTKEDGGLIISYHKANECAWGTTPKELANYKQNILATISIIINYFKIEKLNKNLFLNFNIPKSRGSKINYRMG